MRTRHNGSVGCRVGDLGHAAGQDCHNCEQCEAAFDRGKERMAGEGNPSVATAGYGFKPQ
jgi:hypothetical protein